MKVRFENFLREKCEECEKPAKWKCYENAWLDGHIVKPLDAHYYCDKCVKET